MTPKEHKPECEKTKCKQEDPNDPLPCCCPCTCSLSIKNKLTDITPEQLKELEDGGAVIQVIQKDGCPVQENI